MRSKLARAAKSRVPLALSASAEGWRPTAMRGPMLKPRAAGVKVAIASPPHSETKTRPSGPTTTWYG